MAESMRDRETDLINYLRNSITDPSSRGTTAAQTYTATAGQTLFTLTNTLVKNIISVTVNGTSKYIGYHYTINLGEGNAQSTVTLLTASTVGDTVVITYKYGSVMVYEGYLREDVALPRVALIFDGATPEFVSIGEDDSAGGKSIYYNARYTCEIRSNYAKQMKTILNDVMSVINKYRQTTPQPYKTIVTQITFIQSYDFDQELRIYRGFVSFTIKWLVKYKD